MLVQVEGLQAELQNLLSKQDKLRASQSTSAAAEAPVVSGPAVQQGSRTTELEALVAALGQRLTDAEESAAGSAADLAFAAAERDQGSGGSPGDRLHQPCIVYRPAGRSLEQRQ